MASNRSYTFIVLVLIIVLSIVGYSAYLSFLPTTTTTTSSTTITTGPVSINAYWLNTNITLGESVTFIVKTPSSNFTAEIWKVNAPDKLVAQYKGKGGLSQDFSPSEAFNILH